MTFYASLSFIALSVSVTLPTLSHFVSPSNIFSNCFPLLRFPSFIPVITKCSSFSLDITWPKKVARRLCILFMGDLVVSTSCNTVLFDFFAFHDIYSILQRNHISVSFVPVLKLYKPPIHRSK